MLTHYASTIIVFQSSEYNNFTMINGNRGLNNNKINKIIAEIESGNDMLQYYPIQVRIDGEGKLQILDGQHRFFICKKLKRTVHYIMVSEAKSISDIAKVNSNVEKWKQQDFINCYINTQNSHYSTLQKFITAYGINIGTSVQLLEFGHPGSDGSSDLQRQRFENGLFEVHHEDKAIELAEECKLFSSFIGWRDRSFIIAIHKIKKAGLITIDLIHQAFVKYPDMLNKQLSYKQYIYNLEELVNKNKQKRIIIS